MVHAEKCPVCNGSGKYEEKDCHGCNGKGWITVEDSESAIPYMPYVPYVPVYPYCPVITYYKDTTSTVYIPSNTFSSTFIEGEI